MNQTFFQKVILTIFAGFAAACLIFLFKNVFEDLNSAAGNYQKVNVPASTKR